MAMAVEGEVEQAGGAATSMKYLQNLMKVLSGGRGWGGGGVRAALKLQPYYLRELDQ